MDHLHQQGWAWLLLLIVAGTTLGCRVEIGVNEAAALNRLPAPPPEIRNDLPGPLPTPFIAPPTEVTSEPPAPSHPDPSPTEPLASISLTPTIFPTPTSPPPIPAQSPPTRLTIPAIRLDTPVEVTKWQVVSQGTNEISVWDVPENAAGWHQNSALPGQGSNIVFSGHHNRGAEVFRYLVDLKKGDKIVLQADGRDYQYQVVDHFILPERDISAEQRQQNAQWIMATTDERVTLVTCWPYNDNSHRLIVIAK